MARVSSIIPSFVQGMTQQPSELRNPLKADIVKNGWLDPARGASKRAGSRWKKNLPAMNLTRDPFDHKIVRDGERYWLILDGDSAYVFDKAGTSYSVAISGSALTYITSTTPRSDFEAITLADTTLILNRSVTTALLPSTSPSISPLAVVWIKRGNYSTLYKIKITLDPESPTPSLVYEVSYTTPNGTVGTDIEKLRTNFIATQLVNGLMALGVAITVEYTTDDSVFTIRKNDNTEFSIEVIDSEGSDALGLVKNQASRFSELPPKAPAGYKVKVLGSIEEDSDDYWVEFDEDRSTVTSTNSRARRGNWIETTAPSTQLSLDPATMPMRLVRNPGDPITFTLEPVPWEDRTVGDTNNAVPPSFIGKKLSGLDLFRNRLTLLAGGNMIASGSGDLFNFWRTTTLTVVDSDPIDITISTGQALSFNHLIPLNEVGLLVSSRSQLILTSNGPFTPATAEAVPATDYDLDITVNPVVSGSTAFLPYLSIGKGGIRTMSLVGESRAKSSDDITQEVPQLIEGGVRALEVDSTRNALFVLDDSYRVRVYKWAEIDRRLVQSAWGWWEMISEDMAEQDNIRCIAVFDNELYMIIERGGYTTLEAIPLNPEDVLSGTSFEAHLDQMVSLGSSHGYDAILERTNIITPYIAADGMILIDADTGAEYTWYYDEVDNKTIHVNANIAATKLIFGTRFEFLYRSGPPVIITQTPMGGQAPTQVPRIQVINYTIKASLSGPFDLRVWDPRTSSIVATKQVTPRTISGVVINQLIDHEGTIFTLSRNTNLRVEVYSTSHTPLRLQAGHWVGNASYDARPV